MGHSLKIASFPPEIIRRDLDSHLINVRWRSVPLWLLRFQRLSSGEEVIHVWKKLWKTPLYDSLALSIDWLLSIDSESDQVALLTSSMFDKEVAITLSNTAT